MALAKKLPTAKITYASNLTKKMHLRNAILLKPAKHFSSTEDPSFQNVKKMKKQGQHAPQDSAKNKATLCVASLICKIATKKKQNTFTAQVTPQNNLF